VDSFSTSLYGNPPTLCKPTAIPANCRLEDLDARRPGVQEKKSVEFSSVHKHALASRVESFPKPTIPTHQDRLYRQRTGFLKDIAGAD
jgi:hypothetical protein